MKYLIVLVFLIGCAEKEGTDASIYPVSDRALAGKSDLCNNISLTDDPSSSTDPCDVYFVSQLEQALIDYYGGTLDLFNACDSNPYLCRDPHAMEDLIKNIRGY